MLAVYGSCTRAVEWTPTSWVCKRARVGDQKLRHVNCQLSVEPSNTKKSGLPILSSNTLRDKSDSTMQNGAALGSRCRRYQRAENCMWSSPHEIQFGYALD